MIGQVQMINGQKTIVPLTDIPPIDVVQIGNANPITSNAVASALSGLIKTKIIPVTISANSWRVSAGGILYHHTSLNLPSGSILINAFPVYWSNIKNYPISFSCDSNEVNFAIFTTNQAQTFTGQIKVVYI